MPGQFSLTSSVSAYRKHRAIKTRVLRWTRLDDSPMDRHSFLAPGLPCSRAGRRLQGRFSLDQFYRFQGIQDESVCSPCPEAGGLESPLRLAGSPTPCFVGPRGIDFSRGGRASERESGQDENATLRPSPAGQVNTSALVPTHQSVYFCI